MTSAGYHWLSLVFAALCTVFAVADRGDGAAPPSTTVNIPAVISRVTDVRFVTQPAFVDVFHCHRRTAGSPFGLPARLGASRIVVDLPDMQNAVTTNSVAAEPNALVTQARIGQHHDPLKVRVVLDLKNPVAYAVTKQDTGLAIRVTADEHGPPASTPPPAPSDTAAMAPATIAEQAAPAAPQRTLSFAPQPKTPSTNVGQAAATDSAGYVYVAGYTSGSFEGHANAGMLDSFIVKYDPFGATLWIRQLGTPSSDVARAVATNASGHVYLTGSTYGQFDRNTANAGVSDVFVVKYDAQGTTLWTRQFGTPSFDHAYGIASDRNGNVYIGGSTYGSLDGNQRVGQSDVFVTRFNPQGVKLWTRQLGTPGSDVAHAVSADASGNIYVAGYTSDGLDGNPSTGRSDLFVVKYDPHAAKLWTRQLGTPNSDVAQAVATDHAGNLYVVGRRQCQNRALRPVRRQVRLLTSQLGTTRS